MKETLMIPKHQTSYHKKRKMLRSHGWNEIHSKGDFTQFDREFDTESDRDKEFLELRNEGMQFGDAIEAGKGETNRKPYPMTIKEMFGVGHLPCPICKWPVSECKCSPELRKARFK